MKRAAKSEPPSDDSSFMAEMRKCRHDPLRFVSKMFDWRKGELSEQDGPDVWQKEILEQIGDRLRAGKDLTPILIAIASGHGVGKSALIAWIILWSLSTCEDTKGVITANTETQLRTKTWSELAKWYRLANANIRDMLVFSATAIYAAQSDHEKTWRMDMVPWSERNTEAFAGLHNQGKRIVVIFDEGSAIPDVIYEVTEGALTDKNTEIIWFIAGNPTRNVGRFKECFGRFRHRWFTRQIDSRTAKFTNKEQIKNWSADFGEDSDFMRVRVKGEFPRAGSLQFIPGDIVDAAIKREAQAHSFDACVIGCDIARFGDDMTVIATRRGRDARTWAVIKLRNVDLMQVAAVIARQIDDLRPDAVFIDEGGIGAGVVDRLRQLGYSPIGIHFGSGADNAYVSQGSDLGRYANKRAEMWAAMKDWLKVGAVPDDLELKSDLTGVEYGFNARDEIQLEKKEEMKRRGLASPDYGDALALTFAHPVFPRSLERARQGHQSESDPFPKMEMPQ